MIEIVTADKRLLTYTCPFNVRKQELLEQKFYSGYLQYTNDITEFDLGKQLQALPVNIIPVS